MKKMYKCILSHDCEGLKSQNLMGWQTGDTGKSGNVNPKTVMKSHEESMLQMNSEGSLFRNSLFLLYVSLLLYSCHQLTRWSPPTLWSLWRANCLLKVHQFKCKSYPKTLLQKHSAWCLTKYLGTVVQLVDT